MTRKKKPLPLLENITITDFAAEGKCVARVEDMVVFVPWAVPGDVCDLQVRRKKHSFMEAEIARLTQKALDCLGELPESEAKNELKALAEKLAARQK